MSAANHRERLIEFLATLPHGDLKANQQTLELDSLGLLATVNFLEAEYGLSLAKLQVEPDDLRNVERLLAIIDQHAPG